MKHTVQLESVDYSKLIEDVKNIIDIAINNIKENQKTPDYLTREQVAKYFNISLPTVHNWMKAGILKPYKIGNQTRFKQHEIINTPKQIKIK